MSNGKYKRWLEPDGLILIEGWARDGLTLEQIAHNIGINKKTLWEWSTKYNPIGNALKKGREVVDYEVENALLKRALGYDTEEVTTEIYADGKKHIKKVKRHIPADTTAQIFWLKNRKPDMWRNKPETKIAEQVEDDGLIAAIDKTMRQAASMDDSDMLPAEGEE